jgi:hypothetical protein
MLIGKATISVTLVNNRQDLDCRKILLNISHSVLAFDAEAVNTGSEDLSQIG